jgi:hypothetical protein
LITGNIINNAFMDVDVPPPRPPQFNLVISAMFNARGAERRVGYKVAVLMHPDSDVAHRTVLDWGESGATNRSGLIGNYPKPTTLAVSRTKSGALPVLP